MKICIIFAFTLTLMAAAYGAPPVVSSVAMAQRTDGSKIVDVYYDLADDDTQFCTVSLKIGPWSGNSNYYGLLPSPENLSGDVGAGVAVGTGRHIVWNAGNESYTLGASTYKLKVSADDGTVAPLPGDFAYVPSGTFFPTPLYTVTLSPYYIGRYEVTQAQHLAVMGTTESYGGPYPDKPVDHISWLKVISYCNNRSMQEGLNPCYSYADYGTDPDTWLQGWWGYSQLDYLISCDWNANGYRLPTEMEWMYAAMGGFASNGYTYSGGDDIDQVAWYVGNSGGSTHTIGTREGNELEIHDMSGNIREWCWDSWLSEYPTGAYIDPTGPATTWTRLKRGGSYDQTTANCTVYFRSHMNSADTDHNGFRVVRKYVLLP
jgi:formylglycine-generating enzyme required for sulfatase activity